MAEKGSAIVFWHTVDIPAPGSALRALPLGDIQPHAPGTTVEERALCHAAWGDEIYPCIVVWKQLGKKLCRYAQIDENMSDMIPDLQVQVRNSWFVHFCLMH